TAVEQRRTDRGQDGVQLTRTENWGKAHVSATEARPQGQAGVPRSPQRTVQCPPVRNRILDRRWLPRPHCRSAFAFAVSAASLLGLLPRIVSRAHSTASSRSISAQEFGDAVQGDLGGPSRGALLRPACLIPTPRNHPAFGGCKQGSFQHKNSGG